MSSSSFLSLFLCCSSGNQTISQHKSPSELTPSQSPVVLDNENTSDLCTNDGLIVKSESTAPLSLSSMTTSISEDSADQSCPLDPSYCSSTENTRTSAVEYKSGNKDTPAIKEGFISESSGASVENQICSIEESQQEAPMKSGGVSIVHTEEDVIPINPTPSYDFSVSKESSVEKSLTMDELASSSFFISKKLFAPKVSDDNGPQVERCDTSVSEISTTLRFGVESISRENSNTADFGNAANSSSAYNKSLSTSSSFSNGMRRESFVGVVIPNLIIPPTVQNASGAKGSTPSSRLGTPVQGSSRSVNKGSPAHAIERVKLSSVAGDELKRNGSPSSVMSGGKSPTAEQVVEAYGRRIDLLRFCIEKELEACQILFHSNDELDQIPMFKPLVKWLVDHYSSVSPVILYRVAVDITWRTLNYFFSDYKNQDLQLLKSRLFDITEAMTDNMSSLYPSTENIKSLLMRSIINLKEEQEFGNIGDMKEYLIAAGKLIVSIMVDISRVISRQLPQSMRFNDLDFKVTRVLRETDFDVDDVYVLPVKMSFTTIAKRSKQSPSHRMVTFATDGDDA